MAVHTQANTKIYLGPKAGGRILDAIKNAKKSVKILSPYTTPTYVESLLKLQKKGIEVSLITSDNVELDQNGHFSQMTHKDLVKQNVHVNEELRTQRAQNMSRASWGIGIFIILLIVSWFTDLWVLQLLAFLGAVASFVILNINSKIQFTTYSYEPHFKNLRILLREHNPEFGTIQDFRKKFPKALFVHAKMYIVDKNQAFIGSVNFTHNGLFKSYESCLSITDEKAIKDLSQEYERLLTSEDIPYVDIQSWGESLYGQIARRTNA